MTRNRNVNAAPEHLVSLGQPLVDVTYFARDRLMYLVLREHVSSCPL